jgi:hypothetical protein
MQFKKIMSIHIDIIKRREVNNKKRNAHQREMAPDRHD